jgi:murein DD-endopeptidase MepM/ murein hydrolase activator NlpD
MKRLIISEEEKKQIRKSYGLNEALPDLETFPVGGDRFDIGWDKKLQDKLNQGDTSFENPTHNTDFSKTPTYAGAGGHLRGHWGVDIFGPKGTPILAPVSGKVKYNNSNGNTIIIEDPETGFSHWLGHLDSRTIEDGEFVMAGEKVGTLGNTGNASGTAPHLHYNIYKTTSGFESGEDPTDVLKKSIGKKPSGDNKGSFGGKFRNMYKKLFGVEDSSGETKIEAKDEQDLWSILKSAGGMFINNLFK